MNGWIDLTTLMSSLAGQNVHVRRGASFDEDAEILSRAGFQLFEIDGSAAHDEASFLVEAGRALDLPAHYGGTWDSLVDCLGDLSQGQDGRVAFLWKDAGVLMASDPQTFIDAVIVMDRAAFDAAASDDPVQAEVFLYHA